MALAVITVLALAAVALRAPLRRALSAWLLRPEYAIGRTVAVKSGLDGAPYRVHLAHANPGTAADTMAALNSRVTGLLRHLRRKYLRSSYGEEHPRRRRLAANLLARYNPDNLTENSPKDPDGDTSYTVSKGAVLALCLRENDRGGPRMLPAVGRYGFHAFGTLTFVTFHELTHIGIDSMDHPNEFWSAFKLLLAEGEEGGILYSQNFAREPTRYCGMWVDYNPLFDPAVPIL